MKAIQLDGLASSVRPGLVLTMRDGVLTELVTMKAVLFDFDGTLANTAPGIVLTMQETFRAMGLPVPSEDEVRPTIGLLLTDALQRVGGLSDADARHAADVYRDLFPIYEATHVSIFPEVRETLEWLQQQGVRMAICTSRNIESLQQILEHQNLTDFFEICITGSDNLPVKPAPDMVLALLERMKLKKEEALVVGDTTFDILMGNSAGCRTVAVSYGNHSREQLLSAEPTWIIDRMGDLKALV